MKTKIIKLSLLFSLLITFSSCINSSTSSSSSSSLDSINKEDIYYNVEYINDIYTFEGPTSIKENETLFFSLKDYNDSYQNKKVFVISNDKIVESNNGLYEIPNITMDQKIRILQEEKDSYHISLTKNPDLYDIYTYDEESVLPNNSYSFFLKFWGDIELKDVKIKANNDIIYPSSFTKYENDTLYNFLLTNINQDVKIDIIDAYSYTYYEFITNTEQGIIKQKSIYAEINDPYRFSYQFIGWTLKENDLTTLVNLPYLNTTNEKIVKLYAYYTLDEAPLIPTIDINTYGKEINSKELYVPATINVNLDGQKSTYSAQIRLRGNSTLTYPKKPYKIKFDVATSLFGSNMYKDWVLLADYLDASLLKNYAGMTLANNVDSMKFNHTLKHVDVNINGEYQGAYLFTDHIEVQEVGRVEIEEKNLNDSKVPFLLERDYDKSGIDGENMFTIGDNTFIIKYPETPTKNQFNYIYSYINTAYNYVIRGDINNLSKLVNLDSLIDYSLINEIMVNLDSKWKSGFLYKSIDSKLMSGPVWDFDWSFTRWTSHPGVNKEFDLKETLFFLKKDTTDFCFEWLTYLIQDYDFYTRIINRMDNIEEAYLKTLKEISSYYSKIYSLGIRNYYLWYHNDYQEGGKANYEPIENLFVDQYNFVLNAFQERYEYLDSILYKENHEFFIDETFAFIK